MLGKTEQEVFQLQSANNKLQLQLQVTKDSIHTQLNASIHDFKSYKDHISIKLGSADAEIRRLKRNYRLVMNYVPISVVVKRVLHAKRTVQFFSNANNPLITTQTIHILLSWPKNLLHLNVSKVNLSCLMSTYHLISDSAKLTSLNLN